MSDLNSNQKLAVDHINGPCLVLAGPGSGKTKVIAHRIVNMIKNHNIAPTRILAISFTKASSVEMKSRTIELSGDESAKKVNFGTFHSIFFRILRRYSGVELEDLLSENDRYKIIKNILRIMKKNNFNDDEIGDILNEISYVKNEIIDASEYESKIFEEDEFQKIYSNYEMQKNELNKIDFDDMLTKTYHLLMENKEVLNIVRQVFKYILIDEFQDINKVQFEIIKLMSEPVNNIFVVGDEDQSIYGFRGARPDFTIEFEKYFNNAKKIVLKVNYRSTKDIVELSQKLIEKNKNRHEKKINSINKKNGTIKYIYPLDTEEEANFIAKEIKKNENYDTAVIYRTNRQARAFVDAFMDEKIPFILKDSPRSIYDHWVCQDMIAYLRVAMGIGTNIEWSRIVNKPFRYISRSSVKKAIEGDDFLEALLSDEDIKKYTKKNLRDLYEDLNYVRGLAPQYGISYIRTTLDYDRYILDYCHERKMKSNSVIDILNEFESSSKQFKTNFEFFKHIEESKEEIKKSYQKNKEIVKSSDILNDGVVLSTIHSIKGLEFESVYIAGVLDGVIPYKNNDEIDCEDIEEERRLFYVAITRAKDTLVISSPKKRFGKNAKKSEFLDDLL